MFLLVWNCRGFGNLRTKDQLAELVRAKNPSVVFIAETWTDKDRIVQVQRWIDFKNMLEVPQRNKARGLVIFWNEDFDLSIETFSPNHINSTINKNKENEWRFTTFYGEPDMRFRHESWTKLCNLKNRNYSHWICAGNFNEITCQSEKTSGRVIPHN